MVGRRAYAATTVWRRCSRGRAVVEHVVRQAGRRPARRSIQAQVGHEPGRRGGRRARARRWTLTPRPVETRGRRRPGTRGTTSRRPAAAACAQTAGVVDAPRRATRSAAGFTLLHGRPGGAGPDRPRLGAARVSQSSRPRAMCTTMRDNRDRDHVRSRSRHARPTPRSRPGRCRSRPGAQTRRHTAHLRRGDALRVEGTRPSRHGPARRTAPGARGGVWCGEGPAPGGVAPAAITVHLALERLAPRAVVGAGPGRREQPVLPAPAATGAPGGRGRHAARRRPAGPRPDRRDHAQLAQQRAHAASLGARQRQVVGAHG